MSRKRWKSCATSFNVRSVEESCIMLQVHHSKLYTPCPKKIVPFFLFFFSRFPVCGEWCKLHWLLLDTPSFDWNTRRSCGHKMFKMAHTKQQKAFCAVEYAKTTSVITVQRNFRRQFEVDPPDKNSIKRWHTQLMETGCPCKGKSTGRCLCVAYAKAKAPDVVFAYSTAQNAFCFWWAPSWTFCAHRNGSYFNHN